MVKSVVETAGPVVVLLSHLSVDVAVSLRELPKVPAEKLAALEADRVMPVLGSLEAKLPGASMYKISFCADAVNCSGN